MRDQENKSRKPDNNQSAQRGPSQGHASPKTFTLRTHLRAGAYDRENNVQE